MNILEKGAKKIKVGESLPVGCGIETGVEGQRKTQA
jgi:hypothetical protein